MPDQCPLIQGRFGVPIALAAIALGAWWRCAPDDADRAGGDQSAPRIVVELVAELGEDDYPGAIGDQIARASRLRDGRFLASSQLDRGEVAVFDSTGRFLYRFGRFGHGPGEFQAPAFHWLDPTFDTLVVVDPSARRLTKLSADGQETFRTHPFPLSPVGGLFFRDDGTMIVSSPRFTMDAIVQPLHLISKEGTILQSFGSDQPMVYTDAGMSLLSRTVALSGPDHIWVAHPLEYTIERWSVEGELIESFSPELEWFPPLVGRPRLPRAPDDDPPPNGIRGVWEDEEGRLWVVARVPARDWRQQFRRVDDPTARRPYERIGFDEELWDSRFQVWQPRGWRLLADTVVPGMWFGAFGNGYGYSRHLDGPGIPRLRVWHAELSFSR
jgi:hypothetical protein